MVDEGTNCFPLFLFKGMEIVQSLLLLPIAKKVINERPAQLLEGVHQSQLQA